MPRASHGNFISVDRREVESINEIRRLILNYRNDTRVKRPLCIAVFGAPGSGKSFAIKEVSRAILGNKEPLEFNLSQMDIGSEDLHRAFNQVRDASIRQEIPLVFWDEFDANDMQWLASFLAPMNDAEFFDGSLKHPFGKAIFIFAGGTCKRFQEFCQWKQPEATATNNGRPSPPKQMPPPPEAGPSVICHPSDPQAPTHNMEGKEVFPWHPSFVALKGPDFVSRLRGYVNILGPNPCDTTDHTHVLRRAIVLCSEIERQHPELIDSSGIAQICPDIVEAFLRVREYKHGARSISAVLDMSSLAGEHRFTRSALPAPDILALHVSEDFLDACGLPEDVVERLARAGHEGWREAKEALKYTWGSVRDDKAKTHPDLLDWDKLKPESQQANRDCVPARILILRRLGYSPALQENVQRLGERDLATLANAFSGQEHLRWWSNRLVHGWMKGAATDDHLRIHTDICPFSDLKEDSTSLNFKIGEHTIRALEDCHYELKNGGSCSRTL